MALPENIEARGWEELEELGKSGVLHAQRRYNAALAKRKYDKIVGVYLKVADGKNADIRMAQAKEQPESEAAFLEWLEAERLFDELDNDRDVRKQRSIYCQSVMANRRFG